MDQTTLLTLSFFLAAALILAPSYSEAKCNECTTLGIACFNETSYNVCIGGKPDTSIVMTCPTGKVCTGTSFGCVDALSTAPTCIPNQGCGICKNDKLFACTSRTTYAQCHGDKLSETNIKCPQGLVCNSEGGEICKSTCIVTHECDRETPL